MTAYVIEVSARITVRPIGASAVADFRAGADKPVPLKRGQS
jgi:hypothetical protein